MIEVRIRAAVAAETSELSDLFRRSSLSNEGDRASLLSHPEALAFSDLSIEQGRVRVAIVDEQIVGFATLLPIGRVGELEDLFVDPGWMQRGVGRALVRDIAAQARAQGLPRVEVTGNGHALGFYKKVGFVVDGITETRFGPGHRMHLDILR